MYTLSDLIAAGLSEAEAQEILKAQQPASGGASLFAPTFKVSYDEDSGVKKGLFALGGKKNKQGDYEELAEDLGSDVEIIIVGTRGQYSAFDSAQNKSTVTSNLFPSTEAKSAYDLKSGKRIADLKAAGIEISYSTLAAVLIKTSSGLTPAAFYIKGTSLNAFIEATKGIPNGGNITHSFKLSNTKQKKGSTVYFTTNFEPTALPQEVVFKNMKQVADLSKKFNEFVSAINSKSTAPSTQTPDVSGSGEDDIAWN